MSEFFHYFGTALAFFSSISRKKAFVRKIQFWQFSARFSWLWGIKSWWWIWRNESAVNIYPQTGFSHVDGDGALSFVIVKVPFACDGKPSQDSRLSQQRKNSNVHSSKYDDHPTRLMVCFSRQLRSRFSLSLPGRAFSQWLRKAPAIPVSRHSRSGRCPRPFKDPGALSESLSQKTSLLQARRRCDMKNWCVYLCFHMRPISRTLCLRW